LILRHLTNHQPCLTAQQAFYRSYGYAKTPFRLPAKTADYPAYPHNQAAGALPDKTTVAAEKPQLLDGLED